MRKQKTPSSPPKQQEILVNVILDRSGSMNSNREGTISGYNEYLKGLRADPNTDYHVSLVQFDAPTASPELTVSYTDKPLSEVQDLTDKDYEPRGCTPLYDAIGECVRRIEAKGRPVLTVIITDGLENASQEFTKDSIKALIKKKEAEGWKFAFLGANIDSFAVGGAIGASATYTANYTAGNEKAMFATLANATVARSSNIAQYGLQTANSMALFDDQQRATMGGGRPAAPLPFQPPIAPSTPQPPKRSARRWEVRSQVHGA